MSRTSIAKAGLRRLELALESVPEAETVAEIAAAAEDVQAAVAAVAEVVVAEAAAAVVAAAGMEATAAAAVAEGGTNFFVTDSRGLKPRFMKRAATFVAAFFFCEFLLTGNFSSNLARNARQVPPRAIGLRITSYSDPRMPIRKES